MVWDARAGTAFLARALGVSDRRWRRATVDVRSLLERLEGPGVVERSLHEAAEGLGVPVEDAVEDPSGVLGEALLIAQLFLIAATKLGGPERVLRVGELVASRGVGEGYAFG